MEEAVELLLIVVEVLRKQRLTEEAVHPRMQLKATCLYDFAIYPAS
jgi:hypothetical protein